MGGGMVAGVLKCISPETNIKMKARTNARRRALTRNVGLREMCLPSCPVLEGEELPPLPPIPVLPLPLPLPSPPPPPPPPLPFPIAEISQLLYLSSF